MAPFVITCPVTRPSLQDKGRGGGGGKWREGPERETPGRGPFLQALSVGAWAGFPAASPPGTSSPPALPLPQQHPWSTSGCGFLRKKQKLVCSVWPAHLMPSGWWLPWCFVILKKQTLITRLNPAFKGEGEETLVLGIWVAFCWYLFFDDLTQ